MLRSPLSIVILAGLTAAVGVFRAPARDAQPASNMATAAQAWLQTLGDDLRKKGRRPFDDAERRNWHFVPKARKGVALKEMDAAQRLAAHALLRSALSEQGYLKATAVMSLEKVLRAMAERRGGKAEHRDEELYWFLVYGDPGSKAPWAWRVEGHHLSLNFTCVAGEILAWSPSFLGTNPATVPEGTRSGLRVLGPEEDLGVQLFTALTAEQKRQALISEHPPRDIILGPGRKASFDTPQGVLSSTFTPAQKTIRDRLLRVLLGNQRRDAQRNEMLRSMQSDSVRFAFAGNPKPGKPRYWRLHGQALIIELDNVQNGANHVHLVWRDPRNDFGGDALRRHHERQHR